jgi:hypothetical protein
VYVPAGTEKVGVAAGGKTDAKKTPADVPANTFDPFELIAKALIVGVVMPALYKFQLAPPFVLMNTPLHVPT